MIYNVICVKLPIFTTFVPSQKNVIINIKKDNRRPAMNSQEKF